MLYFRLNYPMPPGNKAQIFNSSSSNFFCLIDPATATTINASSTVAYNSIQHICTNETDLEYLDSMPSKDCFTIGTNLEKEFLPQCKNDGWIKLKKGAGFAKLLYDYIGYLIFIEDYAGCRSGLQKLKQMDKSVLENVVDKNVLSAYEMAVTEPSKKDTPEKPLYQDINDELELKYKAQQKQYEDLLLKNIPERIGKKPFLSFFT